MRGRLCKSGVLAPFMVNYEIKLKSVPANKISNNIGMTNKHFNAVLFLSRICSVNILSEGCLTTCTVLKDLLKNYGKNTDIL